MSHPTSKRILPVPSAIALPLFPLEPRAAHLTHGKLGKVVRRNPLEPLEQLNLFPDNTPKRTVRPEKLEMDADALVRWKSRIFEYQQRVRESKPPQQTALFDLTPVHCDPDQIDPFSLRLNTMHFWRMPADTPGYPCIYFVIDNTLPLLLYVGESCQSNQRWKGVHDCKKYVDHYHSLHYQHGLERAVSIAFWFDTPADRKARLDLELSLILRWRSPFNKENWERWGQPFGK